MPLSRTGRLFAQRTHLRGDLGHEEPLRISPVVGGAFDHRQMVTPSSSASFKPETRIMKNSSMF